MSIATVPRKMTTEEFLTMPDDGVERWLLRGELHENRENDMNRRRPDHGRTCSRIDAFLTIWVLAQPKPRGSVYVGDTMFKLRPESDSVVGIDVAYVAAELEARTNKGAAVVDGPPVIAVEVLSPSEKIEDIAEKVGGYLDAGVAQVWVVDPHFEIVIVHRKDREPVLYNRTQMLPGEPELPGFAVQVVDLFE